MPLSLDTSAFTALEHAGDSTSPTVGASSEIPVRFAMRAVPGGRNVSIPYSWGVAPQGTRSFALTLVDTEPSARDWVHWMIVDIPPGTTGISEGASGTTAMPTGAVELRNTFGIIGYGGPQPPAGSGAHPYVATAYALDVASLRLPAGASLLQLRQAVAGHVLASGTCTGYFGR
ncbi:MAG TPA: YbhB/YbcL family Raf kinase inhibitor-like protein [Coriobacteriia bacterium]